MTTVNEKTEVETHTPGPWTWAGITSCDSAGADKGTGYYCIAAEANTDVVLCRVNGPASLARLIAAAPELLHACKFADTVLAFLDEKGGKWDDLRKCLSAAITKATVGD